MPGPDFKTFKKAALKKPGVKQQYDALGPFHEIRSKLIALRQQSGLTQEQLAAKLHTQKSNISRLESPNSRISPKLSTPMDYAAAMGCTMVVDFVPAKTPSV